MRIKRDFAQVFRTGADRTRGFPAARLTGVTETEQLPLQYSVGTPHAHRSGFTMRGADSLVVDDESVAGDCQHETLKCRYPSHLRQAAAEVRTASEARGFTVRQNNPAYEL